MQRLTKREGKHTIRIRNEWRRHDIGWDKLAEYEDLEEQGLLLRLPCKVGTKKLYMIAEDNEIYYLVADEVTIKRFPTGTIIFEYDSCEFDYEDFGKTVFFTKEEAEAKLREMEE